MWMQRRGFHQSVENHSDFERIIHLGDFRNVQNNAMGYRHGMWVFVLGRSHSLFVSTSWKSHSALQNKRCILNKNFRNIVKAANVVLFQAGKLPHLGNSLMGECLFKKIEPYRFGRGKFQGTTSSHSLPKTHAVIGPSSVHNFPRLRMPQSIPQHCWKRVMTHIKVTQAFCISCCVVAV
jgi:hypothetical protein